MDNMKVLVVDDNVTHTTILQDAMQYSGIECQVINDPTKVIDFVKSYQPTLIIMDQEMPHVKGTELVQQIRLDPEIPDIKVVFMSAHCNFENILSGVHLHIVDFIPKTISIEKLLQEIMLINLQINIEKESKCFKGVLDFMIRKWNTKEVTA